METSSLNIVLTGGSGFIGRNLVETLKYRKIFRLFMIGRNMPLEVDTDKFYSRSIDSKENYSDFLKNKDIVIHCAGRVHIMADRSSNPLEAFREVNTYGTLNLARQAAEAGLKRFIFISSIKVNGEFTELDKPFKPDDEFIPKDHYGLSKYEAEIGLHKIAKETGMEVVIIRPPLVYGPGVKANFSSMMKWMNKGFPLPLGGIKGNKRSLVSVDNLVDLIITCIDHPKAKNQTFLVSDDDDVSTSQLLANMAIALDTPNRLLPISSSWFTLAAKLIGKPEVSQRLCGSLQVDVSKTKQMLNWQPCYSSAECMKKTANAFLENLNLNK
jgi:UDP-glucose 4-epimerase